MKAILLLEKLRNKTVFRVQDIERVASCNRAYAKLLLNRLKKNKLIKRVTKNTYTTKDNVYVISTNITYPSYLSFWSASNFLGYTEQILNTVQIATTRKIKPILFEGYKIEFIPIKYFFGYKKIKTNDGEIFIVENEKLLIDSFLNPKKFGNFNEIQKVFENTNIDALKMVSYLKRINKQIIIKKVGFLLEKTKNVDISRYFKLDKNYAILNPFSKKWKKIYVKWRIKK